MGIVVKFSQARNLGVLHYRNGVDRLKHSIGNGIKTCIAGDAFSRYFYRASPPHIVCLCRDALRYVLRLSYGALTVRR